MNKIVGMLVMFGFSTQLYAAAADQLTLNNKDYFSMPGLDVTVFSDIYPDGHQTGVTVIQQGTRVAANGDLRLEISPGQWSPVPVGVSQQVDRARQTITQTLSYPDPSKDKKGFNPINYPDLQFSYQVSVTALTKNQFKIRVDLDKPLPPEWVGKIGFNLELFPGHLFGKSWLLDDVSGIFPRQANGPVASVHQEDLALALARGHQLSVAPESDAQRIVIESKDIQLELWDGRSNHNNGWFIVRSAIPAGKTQAALEWVVTPNVVKGWKYTPVLQVSQVGYGTQQQKHLVIEQDARDTQFDQVHIFQLTPSGKKEVLAAKPEAWGNFLRYQYARVDFSAIKQPGSYLVEYRGKTSQVFQVSDDVYSRHVWQPTLEYFLPMQMCHMRVNEKYRVWHGLDHLDDARMAPINYNHYDGYISGASTLTKYKPGETVPGLNAGGWHDAGDFDLRVESQMGTVWLLAAMIEEFGLNYDSTSIDQQTKTVEIHQPDGKNDALQQIEHGLLSVLGGYNAMGRVYRGIIDSRIRQYVLLGDASVQTNNVPYQPKLAKSDSNYALAQDDDDRWVFTEDNPDRELYVAAGLAAASRVLKNTNPAMAKNAVDAAETLFVRAYPHSKKIEERAFALAELLLTTKNKSYAEKLINEQAAIVSNISKTGWSIGRAITLIDNADFSKAVDKAVADYQQQVSERARTESPYGVPYKPNIWGAGWNIQEFGVQQYFFHKAWPNYAGTASYENALNFILGVHPGENNSSFASGVGAKSATVAYGNNRADWSYIPGGVVSGTALIRPDLPELKVWPYFWQQTEYVMGGGETNYMFLVLAVDQLQKKDQKN